MSGQAMREGVVVGAMATVAAASRVALVAFPVAGGLLYVDSFALVGATSVAAGFALRSWKAALAPLLAMLASDAALYAMGIGDGHSAGFLLLLALFVYSGFALVSGAGALVGRLSDRMHNRSASGWAPFAAFLGGSLWGSLLFDAWTNAGFWLGPFYPHDWQGLAACMVAGIPFALGHLLGMALLSPLAYGAVALSRGYLDKAGAPEPSSA